MAHPYETGQRVFLNIGESRLAGVVRELTLSTALVAFEFPTALEPTGTLMWPDGVASSVDLARARVELVMRVAIPELQASESERQEEVPGRTADGADHRRTLRLDTSVDVRLADPHVTGSLVVGKTINVSSGGALVVAEGSLIVGKEYVLQIQLPQEPMLVRAKPIRRTGHRSYALRFLVAPEVGHKLMRRLMATMRTGTPPGKRAHVNFRKA